MLRIYDTEDQAAARVDAVRQATGAWPGYLREGAGWRLTFDPDYAAGERTR